MLTWYFYEIKKEEEEAKQKETKMSSNKGKHQSMAYLKTEIFGSYLSL